MIFNKHDIDNVKRWFRDKWWRFNRSDEAVFGVMYIIIAGVVYWIVK